MKQLDEIVRMQQLAGINEIEVNNPGIRPNEILNEPYKTGKILCDVWVTNRDIQAIPQYELDQGYNDYEGELDLYINKGDIGFYFPNIEMFESIEGHTTRLKPEYFKY